MENVRNIIMKCNKNQFESIKPKLIKGNIDIFMIGEFKYYYLCHFSGQGVTNGTVSVRKDKEIHEQWNEKVFLEACGIFEEPKFEITKEQILELSKDAHPSVLGQLKEWFPEVFETVLEVGKWYKNKELLVKIKCIDKNYTFIRYHCYGFNCRGYENFSFDLGENQITDLKEATTEEKAEALKNEAVKRYKVGDYVESVRSGSVWKIGSKDVCNSVCRNYFQINNVCVFDFDSGKWAEIIPTKTIKEAEELLNCKIV